MEALLEAPSERDVVRLPEADMRHLERMNGADSYDEHVAEQARFERELQRKQQRTESAYRRDVARRALNVKSSRGPQRSSSCHGTRREPRRRPHRAAATRRRIRSVDREPDPEPPAAACPGCGDPFQPVSPRQRYCSKACANAARQRRWYGRHAAAVERPEPAESKQPPRVTAAELGGLRDRINADATERLQVWLELPTAPDDRRQELLNELRDLEAAIAAGWDEIRTAEAVAS